MSNKIIPYNPKLKDFAQYLRNHSTASEITLWNHIRRKALGVEFHRQVPVLGYIVDFYCHELALAIEVDGNIHEFNFLEDCQRQEAIEKYGITFVRFSNEEINTNLFGVLLSLENTVNRLKNCTWWWNGQCELHEWLWEEWEGCEGWDRRDRCHVLKMVYSYFVSLIYVFSFFKLSIVCKNSFTTSV